MLAATPLDSFVDSDLVLINFKPFVVNINVNSWNPCTVDSGSINSCRWKLCLLTQTSDQYGANSRTWYWDSAVSTLHIFSLYIRSAYQFHSHSTDIQVKARVSERTFCSSAVPLLDKPFARTDFARRAFRCSAPTVWNSPETVISADSLSVFKCWFKTYFFRKAFDLTPTTDLPPASLKPRPIRRFINRSIIMDARSA